VLPGVLAFEPASIARVRIRFAPAEAVKVAEMRPGARVKKGDLLAVFHSVEVGNKKSDLLDALVKLSLDQQVLDRAEQASDAVPLAVLLKARRQVAADQVAVARARATLRAWGIAKDDLKAIEVEAKRLVAAKGKFDADKKKAAVEKWGRVEVRAPRSGVVVERNVVVNEIVADVTVSLFTIAEMRKLKVIASVNEQDLPALLALQKRYAPRPLPWQVRLARDGKRTVLKSEGPDEVGYLIDPNQHTATVVGQVDNADGKLRAGQMVKVTVPLASSAREMVVPTSSLVEAGGSTYIFVQADPKTPVFTQRRVVVVRRGLDRAHVRLVAPAKDGKAEVHVVTEGALELKSALDDLRE
jgi:cobalt-zinc-cadmium efflux system membrane fusion protein